jgi:FMN-dependent NADH-azoreductase
MVNILHIDSSANLQTSFSRKYSQKVVDFIRNKYVDCNVMRRDLVIDQLPFITADWFAGAYTEENKRTHAQKVDLAIGDALIDELMDSTHVVIGSPMNNYTISVSLKLYIDHICRFNKTFTSKYEGLVKNKKVYLIMSRGGGNYEEGESFHHMNFQGPYLHAVLGSIGMNDIQDICLNNMLKGQESVKNSCEIADKVINSLVI